MSQDIKVPDIGDFDAVEVIEVLVSVGDTVEQEQALITLESDKATLEVPSTAAGKVTAVKVSEGDKVSQGDVIVVLEAGDAGEDPDEGEEQEKKEELTTEKKHTDDQAGDQKKSEDRQTQADKNNGQAKTKKADAGSGNSTLVAVDETAFAKAHASPGVRKYARELGVDLGRVNGSGPKGRILKENIQEYVKQLAANARQPGAVAGLGLPEQPEVDFSQFGDVEQVKLARIRKISAKHVHRSWLLVPHVTQFDEADITALEVFRKAQKAAAEKRGVKLTLLAFLLKASAAALKQFPDLNSSLGADEEHLVQKKYVHIGVAVDTDDGLIVPVIRDVDKKGIFELAQELGEVSERARSGKLKRDDLQGGCFSISSLGGIGGTAFTPIVNAPEVAILGVSRAKLQPIWEDDPQGGRFNPRLMLPLSLSYDHRVIDGALAARVTGFLSRSLGDIRTLLL